MGFGGPDDFEEPGGDGGTSAIGRPLFDPNTFEFLGTLIRGAGDPPMLLLRPPPGSGQNPRPFAPGVYGTALETFVEVDAQGNQRQTRTSFPTGTSGGRTLGEETALIGVETEAQMRLAEQRADIDMRLWEAMRPGNLEDQIALLTRRAEIDDEARRRGWDFEKWMTVVDQNFQLKIQGRDQAFQKEILGLRQQWDEEQARLGREFTAEENQLARENQMRITAINELGARERAILGIQEQARGLLAQLTGQDQFRSAAALQGGVLMGRTPAQGFAKSLQQAVHQPTPNVRLDAPLEELTGALQTTPTRPQLPAAPTLGLRGGGVLEMQRGRGGAFTIQPDSPTPDVGGNTGVAVLVGEKAPEVMEIREGEVRVIPLVARGQGGLTVTQPQQRFGSLARPGGLGARAQPTPRRAQLPAVARPARAAAPVAPTALPARVRPQAAVMDTARALTAPAQLPAPAARPEGVLTQGITVQERPPMGIPPTGIAAPQVLPPGAGPGAGQLMQDLMERFPNLTSMDALLAEQAGLADVAAAILKFTAGVLGQEDLWDTLKLNAPGPGEEPGVPPPPEEPLAPLTPEQEIEWLESVVGDWPNITSLHATGAYQAGLDQVGDAILQYEAGMLTQDELWNILTEQVPGLVLPELQPEELPFSPDAMRQAIATVYRHLGIDPVVMGMGPLGAWGFESGLPESKPPEGDPFSGVTNILGQLGVQQRVFRDSETGQVYVLLNGELRELGRAGLIAGRDLEAWGINPADVISVSPANLAAIAPLGGPLHNLGEIEDVRGALAPGDEPFPPWAAPMVEPVTGLALPQPRAITSLINRLPPGVRNLIMQAYEQAGVSLTDFGFEQRFFTPGGTFHPSQTARLG